MLTALCVAVAVWASPHEVAAQAPGYAPAAGLAYEPPLAPLEAPRPTRSNRIHIVGLVLGAAGAAGGAVLMLGGALCGLGSSSSGSCGAGGMFIAGAVILPVGVLALIGSLIALAVDRVPFEPRIRASASPEGAMLSLDMAF